MFLNILDIFAGKIVRMLLESLKSEVTTILANNEVSVTDRLQMVCRFLKDNVSYYDWVGFYFKNGDKEELILRTYAGLETDHKIIPFGKGICGQVAISNENFVVPDVQAQDNYISCSIDVKSEIVIPLFKDGQNIGQIDIDSDTADPFSEEDERFLEFVNQAVAKIL